jgi:hypothetical protein
MFSIKFFMVGMTLLLNGLKVFTFGVGSFEDTWSEGRVGSVKRCGNYRSLKFM